MYLTNAPHECLIDRDKPVQEDKDSRYFAGFFVFLLCGLTDFAACGLGGVESMRRSSSISPCGALAGV